jgi:hypothetical protein
MDVKKMKMLFLLSALLLSCSPSIPIKIEIALEPLDERCKVVMGIDNDDNVKCFCRIEGTVQKTRDIYMLVELEDEHCPFIGVYREQYEQMKKEKESQQGL